MVRTIKELREYLEIAPNPPADSDPRVKVEVYRAVTFKAINALMYRVEELEEKVDKMEGVKPKRPGIYSGE